MTAISFVGGVVTGEYEAVETTGGRRAIKVLTKKDPLTVYIYAKKGSVAERELSVAEVGEPIIAVGIFRSPIRDRDDANKIQAIVAARASNTQAIQSINLVFLLGSLGKETDVKKLENNNQVCNRAIFSAAALSNLDNLLADPGLEVDDEFGLPTALFDNQTVIMASAWGKAAEQFSALDVFTPVVGIGTLHGSKAKSQAALPDRSYFSLTLSKLYGLPIVEPQAGGVAETAEGDQKLVGAINDLSGFDDLDGV